jgi:glycerol-3-phosphate dehydrogenase
MCALQVAQQVAELLPCTVACSSATAVACLPYYNSVLLHVLCVQVAQQAAELLPSTAACSSATARHLAAAYGDQAPHVLQLAASQQLSKLLVQGHPYLEAEVVWAVRWVLLEGLCSFVLLWCGNWLL